MSPLDSRNKIGYCGIMLRFYLFFSIILCSLSFETVGEQFPLSYSTSHGAYKIHLYVGKQKTPISCLVDTGSANLNFLSNKTKCTNCDKKGSILNESLAEVKPRYPGSKAYFDMHYGKGGGLLRVFDGPVGLSKHDMIPVSFSVYTQGEGIGSTLGLGFSSIAAPPLFPIRPFFDSLEANNHSSIFSLKLCAGRGNSYLTIGPEKIDAFEKHHNVMYTPIVSRGFYTILLNQISAVTQTGDDPIDKFGPNPILKTAILDSGTTGEIILPQADQQKIIIYLYEHTSRSNQSLPQFFWKNNACINDKAIDFSHFPSLDFSFVQWKHPAQSIHVIVSPNNYLTHSGCSKNAVHIAFVPTTSLRKSFHNIPLSLRKFISNMPSSKILGAPFLGSHTIIFNRSRAVKTFFGNKGIIGFARTRCS